MLFSQHSLNLSDILSCWSKHTAKHKKKEVVKNLDYKAITNEPCEMTVIMNKKVLNSDKHSDTEMLRSGEKGGGEDRNCSIW